MYMLVDWLGAAMGQHTERTGGLRLRHSRQLTAEPSCPMKHKAMLEHLSSSARCIWGRVQCISHCWCVHFLPWRSSGFHLVSLLTFRDLHLLVGRVHVQSWPASHDWPFSAPRGKGTSKYSRVHAVGCWGLSDLGCCSLFFLYLVRPAYMDVPCPWQPASFYDRPKIGGLALGPLGSTDFASAARSWQGFVSLDF